MGLHQCLTVIGFYAGIEDRKSALAEQPVKATFAAVLEAVDLMVGEYFKAALGGDQSIDGRFLHEG